MVPLFAMFYCTISFILFVYLYQSAAAIKYQTAYEKLSVYAAYSFELKIFMHWMMEFLPYSRAITAGIDDPTLFDAQKWLYSSIFAPPTKPPEQPGSGSGSNSNPGTQQNTNLATEYYGDGPSKRYKPIEMRFTQQYDYMLGFWSQTEQQTRIALELGISDRDFQEKKVNALATKPVYSVSPQRLFQNNSGKIYDVSEIPANIHAQYIMCGLKVITEVGRDLGQFIQDTDGGRTVLLGNQDWLAGIHLMQTIGVRCLSLIATFLEFGESDIQSSLAWYRNILIPLLRSNFTDVTIIFFVIYGFVILFNLSWMIYSNYWINKHMTKLIGCYCMLTEDEILFHKGKLQKQRRFFEITSLSDEELLSFNTGQVAVAKRQSHHNQAKNLRMNKLTKDKMVPSIKVSLFLSLLVTGIYSLFIMLAFFSMSSADRLRQFDLMFIEQTDLIFKLCESVIQTESYVLFGDYFKLDGDKSGKDFNPTAVSQFNSYWISSRESLNNLLGDFYPTVDTFINKNACSLLQPNSTQLCFNDSLANSNGFLYFSVYLERSFQNTLLDYQTKNATQLGISSDSFGFVGESSWYSSDFLNCRIIFIESMASFYRALISAYPGLLQKLYHRYSSEYHDVIVGVLTGCGLFILMAASISRYLTHRDKDYCHETFKVIQPETILYNAYILNSFKKYYG